MGRGFPIEELWILKAMEMTAGADPLRVLIVDDEPSVARTIARWLEAERIACDVAFTVPAALELADRHAYAIVIADLHMPDGSGLDLARRFKAGEPVRQVLIMTGDPAVERAVEAFRVDVDDYLVKPFERGAMVHAVRRAAEHRRLLLENLQYRSGLETRVQEQAKRLERLFLSSIHSLVTALEAKDPYTRGHSDRVTQYALSLLREVGGCDPDSLRLGAQLHDIGKIGISGTILAKHGPLSASDWQHLRQHPLVGVRILSPLLEDRVALDVVRHHHERWDGSGYPDGLAGARIPLAARIVAIADAFDAMTTMRPYRPARTAGEAIVEIEAQAGIQFDPDLVSPAGTAFMATLSAAS
jgi:putative two-component system response regulator